MDEATFLASVSKTHRAIIVEEAWRSVSISAEVSARIMEKVFYDLDVPLQRLCGAESRSHAIIWNDIINT
jgi:pyruvate dehydrogenase E1 component beta subunit